MLPLSIVILSVLTLSHGYNTQSNGYNKPNHGYDKPCSDEYGAKPCNYLPAPPGKRPPCAQPGTTFCEHPEHYPVERIHFLVQQWRFDHSTILTNEVKENIGGFYPAPRYAYPENLNSDSYFPEPIDIPKPNYHYPQPSHSYLPAPINYTHYQEQPYKYSKNIPPSGYNPDQNLYSSAINPYYNKLWNGKAGYERRRKRSVNKSNNMKKLRNLMERDVNGTLVRTKRQSSLTGQTLCSTQTKYIMPRAAVNSKGNWMFVVNMPELDNNIAQLVKSETCASETCNGLCQLPLGTTSKCEQKYVQKKLVALEGAGNELYNDIFWFPSCCVCTIS